MMNDYMVEIILPKMFTPDFVELIPRQIHKVNELMLARKLTSYSLSADRSRVWVTVLAKSRFEAESIVAGFPIISFVNYTIHELAFHNAVSLSFPQPSMN